MILQIVPSILCYFCIITLADTALIEVKQVNVTADPMLTKEIETPDNECISDPCLTLGKQCQNDGECVTEPTTCKSSCVCTNGYYGDQCQYEFDKRNTSEETETKDSKSVTPKTSVTDCSGKVCLHGECVPAAYGTTRCQCNDGWFGETCGTFGAVMDDDFLKSLTESIQEKFSKIERKDRLHAEEGDRHPKNMSDFVINGMDVFRIPSDKSKTDLSMKENKSDILNQSSEMLLQSSPIKISKSLIPEDNDTVIEDNFQRYNVCSEQYIERSEEERTCEHGQHDVKCVYGVCNETEVDYGTWTGYETDCVCDYGSTGKNN